MNWISVKDRLPETDCYVLCRANRYDDYQFFVAKLERDYFIGPRDFDIIIPVEYVTHWMQLPTCPEEK